MSGLVAGSLASSARKAKRSGVGLGCSPEGVEGQISGRQRARIARIAAA
jgi:hypothetical protein